MAVTFTNKAAREMKERVSVLLGHGARCWVSTFHASCAKLLRTYGEAAGVNPQFTIYDDGDQKAMVSRALKELSLSEKQFPPRAVQNEINRAKRELVGPEDYPGSDFYRERIRLVYELYEKRMRDASALDFGDLLYRTVKAMQDNRDLAKQISGLFDYVMVDEFQDTNRVQLELVRLLTPHRNICVVGDDDQSIYSWRGADVTNILDFEKLFPGASVVTLDRNYRSTGKILKAAHGVVSRLQGRRPKELWTDNEDGDQITVIHATDEREEARIVADKVRELDREGVSLSEQAIFYRTNAQSRVFEEVMRSLNIPHRVLGGMRFYERAEVKDVIAYLRLVQNTADHTAFIRVVNTPIRGIGKTTVDKLVALAAGKGLSAYDAIPHAAEAGVNAGGVKKLTAFRDMVESWARAAGGRPRAHGGPHPRGHRVPHAPGGGEQRRGRRPHGEHQGARRLDRGLRGGRGDPVPRRLPRAGGPPDGRGRGQLRRGPGHPHDGPLGQGARVRRSLRDRARGGPLPLPQVRGQPPGRRPGSHGGGAAAGLRGHDPRPQAALPHPGHHQAAVRQRAQQTRPRASWATCPARSSTTPPRPGRRSRASSPPATGSRAAACSRWSGRRARRAGARTRSGSTRASTSPPTPPR